MGANAQIEVPAFTAGQVLTAAEMTQINTGIPVFATTVTRDAAFGGAGEKVLAEGQFAYIEATNATQYYDGTAWQTVGGSSGFVCVKSETTFTGATTVEADSVFSSAYTNYKMFIRYQTSSTGDIYLRLRASGVSATGANYNSQLVAGTGAAASGFRETSQTSMYVGDDSNGAFWSTIELTIYAPNVAEPTLVTSINNRNTGAYTANTSQVFAANHTLSTAYDGVQITLGSGTITGAYTIYGYGKTA
jgi:hypothetical protein